jgi:hypothetical protein
MAQAAARTPQIARARERVGRVFRQRCFYLFLVLVGVLVAAPLATQSENMRIVFNVFNMLVLISAVAAVGRTLASFVMATLLAISTMLLHFFAIRTGDPALLELYYWCLALFCVATTVYLLIYVLQQDVITMDKLYGAAAGYLMLGFVWAIAYSIVQHYYPGSFSVGGTPVEALAIADRLYFSITVLTTTGFGDIVPVRQPAKTLVMLEQIVGTLFVAILIARLAGAYPPRPSRADRS